MEQKYNANEVKEVARMQQKIDAYEIFILSTILLINGNKNITYPLFAKTPLDKAMNRIWKWVKEHK